ncbi:hypothetical protein GCM10011578_092410 [Streptomyces fuscichromogenes]|uniref:Uncharacterized protein n=1 Tax=Streptomyces fuscichromogenes TaxID=1324013 RepID=A0A917XNN5_9ACTN|nr:hypothetical protein GCM10011578_092410 [Streptomyces fuscichromogenes]
MWRRSPWQLASPVVVAEADHGAEYRAGLVERGHMYETREFSWRDPILLQTPLSSP